MNISRFTRELQGVKLEVTNPVRCQRFLRVRQQSESTNSHTGGIYLKIIQYAVSQNLAINLAPLLAIIPSDLTAQPPPQILR